VNFIYFCRLSQTCNHIAALIFYIEYHACDDELPTEKSQISLPINWNQPPKKMIAQDSANQVMETILKVQAGG